MFKDEFQAVCNAGAGKVNLMKKKSRISLLKKQRQRMRNLKLLKNPQKRQQRKPPQKNPPK